MKILCRYVLAWMGALGIMNVYFCRINLSVAMVAMVGVTRHSNLSDSQCPDRFDSEELDLVMTGEFEWDKKLQGLVMGSYYWGYAACQVHYISYLPPYYPLIHEISLLIKFIQGE